MSSMIFNPGAYFFERLSCEYFTEYSGALPKEVVKATALSLKKLHKTPKQAIYPVKVSFKSFAFYSYFSISVFDVNISSIFKGKVDGIVMGNRESAGRIYVSSEITFPELIRRTTNFEVNNIVGFSNINLFDSEYRPLAHLICEGTFVSKYRGIGGGGWF